MIGARSKNTPKPETPRQPGACQGGSSEEKPETRDPGSQYTPISWGPCTRCWKQGVTSCCGVPQFQLPQRTPGQTRQARGGRRGAPGGARAGPGAHCGVGPAWVLEIISNQKPSPMSCPAHRIGLSSLSNAKVVLAPPCAPAAGRTTPWSGPPCDRPPQSASVEEASRSA